MGKKVDSDSGWKLLKFGASSGSDSDSGVGIAHLWKESVIQLYKHSLITCKVEAKLDLFFCI